ncbi:MAG: TIGR01777 family oxidoreductase [Candidatus Thermoplasmatota archaeon]|nr:TIGR01777 family oxidoreductase [Candidatus Thermoplasmatota archaeon]
MVTVRWELELPYPQATIFDWYESVGSFNRLMPPWEISEVVHADNTLENGAQRIFRFPFGPIKMKWVAEHLNYDPPNKFEDVMIKGPFRSWHHSHQFKEIENGTLQIDEVTYKLPLGFLGKLVAGRDVRNRLNRMFKARQLRLMRDMEQHSKFSHIPRKRILIAGSSGLIGTQLVAFLDTGGHDVWRLVRRPAIDGKKELSWDPDTGELEPSMLEGFDVIIHLGGAGIGDKRWNKKRKALIVESRRKSTTLLSDTMAKLDSKPEAFIVASAIGYYGNRGDEELSEESGPGSGFLTDTTIDWEGYSDSAREAGIRVVNLRNGIVLSATGGALGRMLLPWKMGAGGPLAGGRQWMSWISLDDEIYAIHHLMMNVECSGAYNLTAPNPVRQKVFSKSLGKVLRRPAFAPIPGFMMKILFGELAGPLLIQGQKVLPNRLIDSGFEFTHSHVEDALRDVLGRW